ncbi:MAG TPA: substrate-binding domain-containing protein [Longimicrobiales bacterium]
MRLRLRTERRRAAGALLLCTAFGACADAARPPRLVLGTTHTLEDSGLLDVLLPAWERDHGTEDRLAVVVAGSGEVLSMARRGDLDVVLSHAPAAEIALVQEGIAESREPVMHNSFVLLGPAADPAGARAAASAAEALRRIAQSRASFVSRADDSGTHRKERELWRDAGIGPGWDRYIESGTGMADALRIASQRQAYILTDRATWTVLSDELALEIVHESAGELHNQYSVLILGNARNAAGARRFAQWIRSPSARRLIGSYGPAAGPRLFIPDAPNDTSDRP